MHFRIGDYAKASHVHPILDVKYYMEALNLLNSKLENQVLIKLIRKKKISAYITLHRYYSLSNMKRYFITNRFFKNRNKFFQ